MGTQTDKIGDAAVTPLHHQPGQPDLRRRLILFSTPYNTVNEVTPPNVALASGHCSALN